jgi:hypothetical protein
MDANRGSRRWKILAGFGIVTAVSLLSPSAQAEPFLCTAIGFEPMPCSFFVNFDGKIALDPFFPDATLLSEGFGRRDARFISSFLDGATTSIRGTAEARLSGGAVIMGSLSGRAKADFITVSPEPFGDFPLSQAKLVLEFGDLIRVEDPSGRLAPGTPVDLEAALALASFPRVGFVPDSFTTFRGTFLWRDVVVPPVDAKASARFRIRTGLGTIDLCASEEVLFGSWGNACGNLGFDPVFNPGFPFFFGPGVPGLPVETATIRSFIGEEIPVESKLILTAFAGGFGGGLTLFGLTSVSAEVDATDTARFRLTPLVEGVTVIGSSGHDWSTFPAAAGPGPAPTPEPGTLMLVGSGLAALTGLAWRRQRRR